MDLAINVLFQIDGRSDFIKELISHCGNCFPHTGYRHIAFAAPSGAEFVLQNSESQTPDQNRPAARTISIVAWVTGHIADIPRSRLRTHLGHNLAAMSFSAGELAVEVKRHMPGFVCTYKPDERQKIADSWPKSVDDTCSRKDWGWKPGFNLRKTVDDMLTNLRLFSVLQIKTPETASPGEKSQKVIV
jgi:nucleoside-diphosphate-sugar epimerase